VPSPTMQWASETSGRRFTGRVKSFSSSNGYGFLTSPEILAAFGQDIFVHQLEVDKLTGVQQSPCACGTCVSFTVVPNKRGQPQARELRFEGGTEPGNLATMAAIQATMMQQQGGQGMQQMQAAGMFQDYATMTAAAQPTGAVPGVGTGLSHGATIQASSLIPSVGLTSDEQQRQAFERLKTLTSENDYSDDRQRRSRSRSPRRAQATAYQQY